MILALGAFFAVRRLHFLTIAGLGVCIFSDFQRSKSLNCAHLFPAQLTEDVLTSDGLPENIAHPFGHIGHSSVCDTQFTLDFAPTGTVIHFLKDVGEFRRLLFQQGEQLFKQKLCVNVADALTLIGKLELCLVVEQKQRLAALREQGNGYKKTAQILGLSENTVKSFYQRCKAAEPDTGSACLCCGKPLEQMPGCKKKKFCSMPAE